MTCCTITLGQLGTPWRSHSPLTLTDALGALGTAAGRQMLMVGGKCIKCDKGDKVKLRSEVPAHMSDMSELAVVVAESMA